VYFSVLKEGFSLQVFVAFSLRRTPLRPPPWKEPKISRHDRKGKSLLDERPIAPQGNRVDGTFSISWKKKGGH